MSGGIQHSTAFSNIKLLALDSRLYIVCYYIWMNYESLHSRPKVQVPRLLVPWIAFTQLQSFWPWYLYTNKYTCIKIADATFSGDIYCDVILLSCTTEYFALSCDCSTVVRNRCKAKCSFDLILLRFHKLNIISNLGMMYPSSIL